jgi:serine protease inhibitor ecotin
MIKKQKITIICEGGWKYTGYILDQITTPFSGLQWIKIKTKTGTVKINAKYIVSILTSKK